MALVEGEGQSGPAEPSTSEDKLSELNRARQVLQAEIDAHKAQIIEKTRRLNDLVDINHLPPEILSEIFFHWANMSGRMPGALAYRPKWWIQIAHVCHLWREISLSTPRLWSAFTADGLAWAREMLSRSKQAPLTIVHPVLASGHKDHQEISNLVFQELQRIESLTIQDSQYTASPKLAKPVSIAPLLSLLSITGNRYVESTVQPLSTFLENIAMPKLTRLELKQTLFSWTTPLLQHSLTRLVFRGVQSHLPFTAPEQSKSTDFGHVLQILEGMPLLEHLDLTDILPTFPEANLPHLDHYVTLPALQSLILSAAPDSCAFLLQHLIIPPSASVEISCRAVSNDSLLNITSAYVSKLREPGSSSTILPLRTLSYSATQIRFWDGVVNLDHPRNDFSIMSPKPRFSLTLLTGSSVQLPSTLISLPLDQVQSLVIDALNLETYGAHNLLPVFARMPNVRELTVQEFFEDISDALGQRLPLTGKQKKGGIPLPKLKTLRLLGIMFRDYIEQDDDGTAMDKCMKMLEARKKSRRGIERLVIKRGVNFHMEDKVDLIPLVKNLEWDGLEDWTDNGEDLEDESEEDSEEDYYDGLGLDAEDLLYYNDDDFPW